MNDLGILPLPGFILAYFLWLCAVSVWTFGNYAIDKAAALRLPFAPGLWLSRERTAEGLLNVEAFFGGWPGALVAQQLLRHKISARSFQFAFRQTVVLHCLAVIALCAYFCHMFGNR